MEILTGKTRAIEGKHPTLLPHFQAAEAALQDVGKVKSASRARLAEIEKKKVHATPNELAELKETEAATREATRQVLTRAYDKFAAAMDAAKTAASKKNTLNVQDAGFQTAISLVKMAGRDLDFETRQELINQVGGNQAHLRALKNMFKSVGIETMNIDKAMYSPDVFDNLARDAGDDILRYQSVNGLSAKLSKLGALEGVDFPQTVDEESVMGAIRTAAGLPEVPPEG